MNKRFIFRGSARPGNDTPSKSSRTGKSSFASLSILASEFKEFSLFFNSYIKEKVFAYSARFEKNKNIMVKTILIKRGKRNRVFLHLSTMGVLTAGVVLSPFITQTNLFSSEPQSIYAQSASSDALSLTPDDVFQTEASKKPRAEIITYTVQKGDTISTIAKKFGISEDTIKWQNDLSDDDITVGDQLQILPVTGVAHKVQKGDTVYTIADKYGANPQAIVDFPFNDFANPQTFSLVEGQVIIVPDGVKSSGSSSSGSTPSRPIFKPLPIAAAPSSVNGAGFAWPIHGTMNQYFSWYHTGVDLGSPMGTPIVAAQDGTVTTAIMGGWNTGYGNYVVIQGANGYSTLYAHMEAENVSTGQTVSAGKTVVGWIGVTGNSTGPHLHFEVHAPGGTHVDPLSVLPQ
jgi:murein DD-endopeptidase MepM/ murein hydrolase activator NlpD